MARSVRELALQPASIRAQTATAVHCVIFFIFASPQDVNDTPLSRPQASGGSATDRWAFARPQWPIGEQKRGSACETTGDKPAHGHFLPALLALWETRAPNPSRGIQMSSSRASAEREHRLAEALRANLHRRKDQARARRASGLDPGGHEPDPLASDGIGPNRSVPSGEGPNRP
jgi:hypothetical protein